jgi:hypothetical protein
MALAIADIVVPDAATTPVNHTFKGIKYQDGVTRYREETATHPSGYWTVGLSLREPAASKNGSSVYRATATYNHPVLVTEVINGVSVPKVAYTIRYNVEAVLPNDCTLQNRKDSRKILVGLLNDSQFKGVFEDLIPPT